MTPLLLPREVGTNGVWLSVIWPGATPPSDTLEIRGGPAAVPLAGSWAPLPGRHSAPVAWHQRIELTGLSGGTRYRLVLAAAGTAPAECNLTTLPERLPGADAAPFTVLLASCFSGYRDPLGALGRAFANLPAAHQPALALLTGDQVYLDTPIAHFLFRRHPPAQLAVEFGSNYAATFGQLLPDGGFGLLASRLAALLTGDDHELWNNAPNIAAHLPDTWTSAGRANWTELASELFDAYQTPRRMHALELFPLSLRVADTRFSRSRDRSRFMDAAALADLTGWLATLDGPAVLVLGQPLLAPTTGLLGHLTDWTIVDYAQYEDLVRALQAVEHDVVLLTGDVHFGRVAEVRLPNGRRLVEIVASPMTLVDDRAGRKWKAPPLTFPARDIAGAIRAPVVVSPFRTVENHIATLAFRASGGGVELRHTAWLVGADGSLPEPLAGFAGRLH